MMQCKCFGNIKLKTEPLKSSLILTLIVNIVYTHADLVEKPKIVSRSSM
jgi:hypothetical protein